MPSIWSIGVFANSSLYPYDAAMADESRVRLDAHKLRGIAHPIRVRMLGELRAEGPATASRLAARLGLNTGATSYHLRQLAAHGFVVEDTGRGTARERWWRAAHRGTAYDLAEITAEDDAGYAYMRSVVEVYAENARRAVEELQTRPAPWRGVGTFSDQLLRLTPDETEQLTGELMELLERYRADDPDTEPPEGTAPVSAIVQVFPRPGSLGDTEAGS